MTDRKDPFFRDPPPRDGGAGSGSGSGGSSGSGGASPRRPTRPVPDDASIPVLTERLTLPPVDLDFTLPVAPESREPLRDFSRPLAPPPRSPEPSAPPPAQPFAHLLEDDDEPPPPSPFVHFSMNSPVGRSFPAAPTFAPPVPPLSAPPPAAVSLGSGAGALPVPPSMPPAVAVPSGLSSSLPGSHPASPASISVGSSVAATPTISATPTVTGTPQTGAHWARIELELRESILRQVAERLPQDVEAIVHRHMASALEEAIESATTALVARVAAEARLALATSLREIVDHAVRAELDRLRGLKR